MAGDSFKWNTPFNGKLWIAELRFTNDPKQAERNARLRLAVHGTYTKDHHFGIEIWDQVGNIPTDGPIDVFSTMQSVASLMQFRIRTSNQIK